MCWEERVRPSGGTNAQRHIRFCSHPELYNHQRRAQRSLLKFWDLKVDLSSLTFIDLTAAVICGGDHNCWRFTYTKFLGRILTYYIFKGEHYVLKCCMFSCQTAVECP